MQAKSNLSDKETIKDLSAMQDNKQTGLANYTLREVPRELEDYLCVYKIKGNTYLAIATLKELKGMNLSASDLDYGYVYVEPSFYASRFYLSEAEDYLDILVEHYGSAPKALETNYYAFHTDSIRTKVVRVPPELSKSSKELFSKIETMQTNQDNATNSIEEENMQAIKDLSDMQTKSNLSNMQEISNLNNLKDHQQAIDKYYSDYVDAVLDLTAGIPTWLNTQPTLVWKLDKEASVMLFADEANEIFTLKDVKNDINFSLTFEQVHALSAIYNANYE